MEEDAGKSLHEGFSDSDRKTYVDFNRSSVPLIEIVTEPDLRSAADAAEFFGRLRAILVWLGVNDGNMEEGSLRCDANVSVRPRGSTTLGTKAEVKNLNSFRFLQKALEFEIERQIEVLESGGRVRQETRLVGCLVRRHGLDAQQGGGARLPVFSGARPAAALVDARPDRGDARRAMPELPDARRQRFVDVYGLPDYDAAQLTQSRALADYFEATVRAGAAPKAVSNWMMGELTRALKESGRDDHLVAGSAGAAWPDCCALIEKGDDQRRDRQGRLRKDVHLRRGAPTRSSAPRG